MRRLGDSQGGLRKEGALQPGLDSEKDGGRASPGERPAGTNPGGRKQLGGSGSAGQEGRNMDFQEVAGPGLCWLWGLQAYGI